MRQEGAIPLPSWPMMQQVPVPRMSALLYVNMLCIILHANHLGHTVKHCCRTHQSQVGHDPCLIVKTGQLINAESLQPPE